MPRSASLALLPCSLFLGALAGACGTASPASTGALAEPRLRGDVTQVTSVDQALPLVFIPPFVDCRAPIDGKPGTGPGGDVCTNVSIAGATEPGRAFGDYASCEVVRTQRPYSPAPPAGSTSASDPRLQDPAFMRELSWVTEQVAATGCTCCHEAKRSPAGPSQWFIDAPGIWTDTVSDGGLALFTGLADSSVLGAYPKDRNHGFDRSAVGLPSTDPARMKAFFVQELARRGISEDDARATPPFGGPIYENSVRPPEACQEGIGVDAQGRIHWGSLGARYVYVLEAGAKNPGVPPNLDLPTGTLFRLDVLASAAPLDEGIVYGATPEGSFQAFPEQGRAPALQAGRTYQLFVETDMGLPTQSCLFTYPAR